MQLFTLSNLRSLPLAFFCFLWSLPSLATGAVPAGEGYPTATANTPPLITLYGDSLILYEPGREYLFTIEVYDPDEGDSFTVSELPYYQLDNAHYSPSLPVTGSGTLTISLRWIPSNGPSYGFITVVDEAGATASLELDLWGGYAPQFHMPAEPIHIGIEQDFYYQVELSATYLNESYPCSPTLPINCERGTVLNLYPDASVLTEAYVGLHQVILTAEHDSGLVVTDTLYVLVDKDCTNRTFYRDEDGDGYGNPRRWAVACSPPEGYVENDRDCDDSDAAVYPGVGDCEGECSEPQTWYADRDGDGWGDAWDSVESCTQPDGYVDRAGDCDDNDPGTHPGATDYPGDGIDQDCDGEDPIMDGDGDGIEDSVDNCYATYNPDQADLDGDGVGDACDWDIDGDGVANEDDCDPYDATVYPGAEEIPGDGKDNNCDGQVDEEEQPATCWADQNLKLEAICSEVSSQHKWMIYNPNSCAVEVKWEVHKSSHMGSMIAPPGQSYFTTPTGDKNNDVVFLHWQDSKGKWKKKGMASSSATCGKQAGNPGKGKNNRLMENPEGLALYPVPFRQQLTLEHKSILSGTPAKVMLISLDGRTLDVSAQIVEQGEGYLQLNLQKAKLANGLYILRLEIAGARPLFMRVLRQE